MNLTSISLLLLSICLSTASFSQLHKLRLSPFQEITQHVGFTKVRIEYSRPSMKGRTIFGDLEAYGELWRTGANQNTTINFSHRVIIGKQEVAPGTYALFTRPGKTTWQVFLYTDTDNWDVPASLDENKIAAQVEITPISLNRTIETLTIGLDNLSESSAVLGIAWENTYVGITIDFDTWDVFAEVAEEEFDAYADELHIAAVYYRDRNMRLEESRAWMEKAINIRTKPDYWDYLEYAKILSLLGQTEEAIRAAETSIELSKQSTEDRAETAIRINMQTLEDLGVGQ